MILTPSNVIDQLKRDEGWRPRPYLDSLGHGTVGYGFTFLTEDEGDAVLRGRVRDLRQDLHLRVRCYDLLDPVRQDALVNWAYNIGVAGVLGFKQALMHLEAAVDNAHDAATADAHYHAAAEAMLFSRWATQVPDRARRLTEQMRSGQYV